MTAVKSDEPNPAVIFETLNAYQRTGALKAAIELRLFSALHAGAMDADSLAAAVEGVPRGVRILCDSLVVLGLLAKSDEQYSLTPTSAMFLDEHSPRYLGSTAKFVASNETMNLFQNVADCVRKGGTLLPDGGSTKVDYEPWVEFARTMGPMMKPAANFIAGLVAERFASRPLRVLDVAASHGLFGLAIADLLPQASIVAQDFYAVLAVTRNNVHNCGMLDRWDFLSG
ncbi:MAG: methyltransferase dimerization domain-containing protein, partial [Planctomycetaceae bacterium]